jgi:glutamine cyclotransferase
MEFLRTHAGKIAGAVLLVFVILLLSERYMANNTSRYGASPSSVGEAGNSSSSEIPTSAYSGGVSTALPIAEPEVLRAIPHDAQSFTQGLAFYNGALYESAGQYGMSSLRQIDPQTGKVLKKLNLDDAYFAEGLAVVKGKAYQLTWQSGIGFIYDITSFRQLRTFSYFGEGWGLTYDGEHLIMSDGTSSLRFLDPDSLLIRKMLTVTVAGVPLKNLNELEMVGGELWANVWQTDSIARIDLKTGSVVGWINCAALLAPEERSRADVLNGIAFDEKRNILLITGKNWSKMFEVRPPLPIGGETPSPQKP